jgi:hypothetical protein
MLKELTYYSFTASKYLQDLERIGILKGEKSGRDMLYVNKGLFDLLKD